MNFVVCMGIISIFDSIGCYTTCSFNQLLLIKGCAQDKFP